MIGFFIQARIKVTKVLPKVDLRHDENHDASEYRKGAFLPEHSLNFTAVLFRENLIRRVRADANSRRVKSEGLIARRRPRDAVFLDFQIRFGRVILPEYA